MADEKVNYKFKRASQITVPDQFFNPLVTGNPDVDETFSELGGIIPSQVIMCTGNPGAGKTTLAIAIASLVVRPIEPAAFISLEMSEFQLAHQAKKIRNFGSIHVTGVFDPVETMAELEVLKPKLVILDSIQKAANSMSSRGNQAQIDLVDMMTKWAKRTWTPVILIGHCDKGGNYKGPSTLLHDVDSHLRVWYDAETGIRQFEFGKNRFGGEVRETVFGIQRDSVWIGQPYIQEAYAAGSVVELDPEVKPIVPRVGRAAAVRQCLANLNTKWDGSTAKCAIKEIVEFLRENDPEFEKRAIVPERHRVRLDFRGNTVAHCHPKTKEGNSELVFGRKTFTKMHLGDIGYAKEQKYVRKHCSTDGELLFWVVVHEWTHLYHNMQHHKNEFFDNVEEKYLWMMAELEKQASAPAMAAIAG